MFSCKIIMSARERAFFLREGIWRNILGIRKGENIMANKIDLHMHSTFSDGTLSPDELIAQLKGQGISVFSLTDHDTMRGVSEIRKRDLQGMIFINGIEFSCRTEAGKCHILGYGYDPQSSAMRGIVETGMAKRAAKMEKRIDYLRERGITLTDEERKTLQPLHSKGKPHLAAILVKRGLARNNDEAIREYIDPVHTGNSRIDAKDAVGAILRAGGIPVWAHPLGGQGEDAPVGGSFPAAAGASDVVRNPGTGMLLFEIFAKGSGKTGCCCGRERPVCQRRKRFSRRGETGTAGRQAEFPR